MTKHHAKFNRNVLRGLVAAFALGGFSLSASAGYAQLANPEGFAGSAGKWTYAANAANDKVYGKVIHQAGGLTANVAGQTVKMSAAYRLAANAPRFAARAVFLNPWVATGVGIAAWLASKYRWNDEKKQWESIEEVPGLLFHANYEAGANKNAWFVSKSAACDSMLAAMKLANPSTASNIGTVRVEGDYCVYKSRFSSTSSWIESWVSIVSKPSTTYEEKPVSEQDFVDDLASRPMPETVPLELPRPTHLPVDDPFINPAPSPNPQSQPFRVPTGQPSPVPNTDPQQWRQPYVDIVPAPTPDQPWRVDIKPGEVTSTDPNPAENPKPDAEDKPSEEKDKSLCEKHPDILACQKPELDVPDGEIPKTTKTVTYTEDASFGGGTCPPNAFASIGGKQTMVYDWGQTCGVVSTYIRPIIILLGAMGALFILIPGRDS